MNKLHFNIIHMDNLIKLLGLRPDIGLLFLVLFCIALILSIILAKKNHLFYFSKKESFKSLNERELMQ